MASLDCRIAVSKRMTYAALSLLMLRQLLSSYLLLYSTSLGEERHLPARLPSSTYLTKAVSKLLDDEKWQRVGEAEKRGWANMNLVFQQQGRTFPVGIRDFLCMKKA